MFLIFGFRILNSLTTIKVLLYLLYHSMTNLVNDVNTYADEEKNYINVVVDIPAGSHNKYEYDHEL